MGFKLKPKEEKFYTFLLDNAKLLKEASVILSEAIYDNENLPEYYAKIDELEHQADETTAKIFKLLNKTFITPLDREDIYAITNRLDDVIDMMHGIVERMMLYNTGKASEGVKQLASLTVETCVQVEKIFEKLPNMKKNKEKLEQKCTLISEMEVNGDHIYRHEVGKLFRECADNPVEIIKWKEILGNLEDTLDLCEDVADLIRGALIKYA